MSSVPDAWVSEPDGRGTWGLTQSCILTVFLCVYSAIHLNIRPQETGRKSWIRRITISLLASVVPEYFIVSAIHQWRLAKQLQTRLNNLENEVSGAR